MVSGIQNIIKKIDVLQKSINEYRPFNNEILDSLQEHLRVAWTYNSNAIEGNTLTYGETAFFLREGLTSEGRPLKDYLEAENHAKAIDYLQDIAKEKKQISESFIRQLHSLLLKGITHTIAKGADGKLIHKPLTPGKYKIRPNHVLTISGNIHNYIDPIHVQSEMEKLIAWYKKEKNIHPIEKASIFHHKFVSIHPFDDGNGRMSRLLMNLILMSYGYPPCIIRNTNRRKYLQSLEEVDSSGKYDSFIHFIASELLYTEKNIFNILEGKEKVDFLQGKKITRYDRQELILNLISEKAVSIGQIEDKLPNIKRATLKSDLKILVLDKKIKKKGIGKGVLYFR